MSTYSMSGLPAPVPIPLRGGKVLARALRAALNLVPGPVGRFRVDLCGPALSLLSETVNGGLPFPLAVFTPGVVAWAYTEAVYRQSLENSRAPISRQGALLRELTGRADTGVGFSSEHAQAIWSSGFPEYISGSSGPRYAALSGYIMGLTGRAPVGLWEFDTVPITLDPALVSETFIGQQSATMTDQTHRRRAGLVRAVAAWAHSYMAADTRPRAAALWARILSAGYHSPVPSGAPDGALEHIGLRAEIWSSDTDPGGEGETSGREDGTRAYRDDEEEEPGCGHCRDGCSDCQTEFGQCSDCGRDLT